MGRVERLLQGKDGQIRSAVVRVHQGGHKSTLFKRPLRKLYPAELNEEEEDVYNAEIYHVEPEVTFVPDHEVGSSLYFLLRRYWKRFDEVGNSRYFIEKDLINRFYVRRMSTLCDGADFA